MLAISRPFSTSAITLTRDSTHAIFRASVDLLEANYARVFNVFEGYPHQVGPALLAARGWSAQTLSTSVESTVDRRILQNA